MLFEVIKNKKTVAHTDQLKCIDDDNTLKALSRAGYSFRLNGNKATFKEVKSFRENGI